MRRARLSGLPSSEASAELSSYERGDPIREFAGLSLSPGFGEEPNDGLGARRPDEDAGAAVEFAVQSLNLLEQRSRQGAVEREVLLHLREGRHLRRGFGEGAAADRVAEQERGGETVAGDVIAEVDDVTRLLPAEERAVLAQRLEDVPVADVRRHYPDAALLEEAVQPEVRHHRHGHAVDAEMRREDREDPVAVDDVPVAVDREHPVAVAVECHAEIERVLPDDALQRTQIRRAAVLVDVRAVGLDADHGDACAEALERARRDLGVSTVCAVDADAQPREIGAESVDHVLQIAVSCNLDVIDRAAPRRVGVEERFDLLLARVAQLLAMRVEELDAVVLRRVVRRRDLGTEVEGEQRDRGGRQHTGQHSVPAGRSDPAGERFLELDTRGARVAADEDATAAGPQGDGLPELLDELRRDRLADDPADTVGSEVTTRHRGARLALAELGRFARLVQAGLLALDDACVACEEARALQWHAEFRVEVDEGACDAVPDSTCLAARTAAVHADPDVVAALELHDLQRRKQRLPVDCTREVLLDGAAVEPRRPVARAQDHARDGRL